VWHIEPAGPLRGFAVMPDGCIDVMYSREGGLRAIGAMTATERYDMAAGALSAGVRFHPGLGRNIFGNAGAATATDRSIPLADMLGRRARELEARLGSTNSIDELVRLLVAGIGTPDQPLSPVQHALEAITAAHGNVDLDRIASQANLSVRQFRRRCLEESGLTPRLLCRILRFRHARELAARAPRDWAGIAIAAGYYDQAHLIHDFREFSGVTPSSVSVFSNTSLPVAV
jgi:AraC-like DNA-binding protein